LSEQLGREHEYQFTGTSEPPFSGGFLFLRRAKDDQHNARHYVYNQH